MLLEIPNISRCYSASVLEEAQRPTLLPRYYYRAHFGSRKVPTIDVPSSSLRFKSLGYLKMNHCKILNSLSKLPPYLRYLDAHVCTSLEEVWFSFFKIEIYP
ncbi:hypothetical protein PVK06_036882 [Gossypium arboreum]|uniref:Uncharacterized protein n=2 Tax=Gossypium arboreum TaxID=29729 RepID=A0ABR0NL23_GOSAR|nr:hypothetical protein PVK06_036882 [Gossypium arboreum]